MTPQLAVALSVALLVACLLVLGACLVVVLAVVVKCYTEILKDRKFDHRAETKGHDVGRPLPRGYSSGPTRAADLDPPIELDERA